MHRIVASVTTLVQHLHTVLTDPDLYRPRACPHCGLDRVWHHGRYHRKADRMPGDSERLDPVPILRFFCPGCCGTCSRLPACIAPRRWYAWAIQQIVLLFLLAGGSLAGCCRMLPAGPRLATVRRWWRWLHSSGVRFAWHLRSRWPELGRHADASAFWHRVLTARGLDAVMAWLDNHACPVP
jgi:hypothetical protein